VIHQFQKPWPLIKSALLSFGEIEFVADSQLALETYSKSKEFGNFILVDRSTKESIGAGMVIAALGSGDITTHSYQIGKQQRSAQKQQSSKVIWLTGLSGSGKSTIANELSNQLFALGKHVYVLDGDNLRSGLNIDLGFTPSDRAENVRRVSQVAKLMVDAGLIVIVALVSPYLSDRQRAKSIFEADEFFEIFVDTPLEICQQRDSKGLYKKAKDGKISNLSGVGQEYEVPTDCTSPEISNNFAISTVFLAGQSCNLSFLLMLPPNTLPYITRPDGVFLFKAISNLG